MAFTALNNRPQAPTVPIQAPAPQPAPKAEPHPQEIDVAFASHHDLRKRVHAAIDQHPTQRSLFRDISTYILQASQTAQASQPPAEPAAKKRKLHDSTGASNGVSSSSGSLHAAATKPWRAYAGVSLAIPQRKKFTLELLDTKAGGIRATGANGTVEFAVAWKDVDQVFCLPIPEKAKKQHHFIVIPVHGDGVNPIPDELKASPPEPMVWTFEEATGKNIVEGEDPGPAPMAEAIRHGLIQAGTGKEVIFPTAHDFSSAVPESHRKGEKAYHVKAHRGSKEGYLFFTSIGILYGFKKPLAFFDFATITSISYTAVLRNTFNLVIATPAQEIEFGMLEQADFAGINDYVQKHGLQDASLAEARRAKKLNVNKPKKEQGGTANGEVAQEEESELQKAERELQQQEAAADEDDDEEDDDDFDPGSEGESEGEGSDTDDEDGGGGYEEGDAAGVGEGYDEDEDGGEEMQQ